MAEVQFFDNRYLKLSGGTMTGVLTSSVSTGTPPFTIASTTKVTNLNVDMVDDLHVGTSGAAIPDMSQANTWSGNQVFDGGARFNDSDNLEFGTASTWQINAASGDLEITRNSGTGNVDLNGASFVCQSLGLGGSSPTSSAIVNVSFSSATITRSLLFAQTYTGSTTAQINPMNITSTNQGSGTSCQTSCLVNNRLDANGSAGATINGFEGLASIIGTRTLSTSGTFIFNGVVGAFGANSNSHTNATILQRAIFGDITNTYTAGSGATVTVWAGMFNGDVQLITNAKLILEGSTTVKGDSYLDFNTTTANKIRIAVDNTQVIDFRAATINVAEAINFVLGTTTGTKIGTSTSQKLGFFNATPIVQVGATIDLGVVLSNLGFRASGTAYPITTSGAVALTGGLTVSTVGLTITDVNVILNTTTGTKIGTATGQKLGFWNATPIIQPASANQAALTDSTTGTPGFTLVDVGVAFSQANVNNNFASLNRQVDAFRTALVNSGIMKGAA